MTRGIEDFARLSPYFNSQGSGDGSGANALSVAGRNTRYNNVQIDGAVNNDLFGLADSGTPGGQTEAQPVSIDAVQELQLVVSPYDVRQGGFSGGGVNAITRSGTNEFHGTGYYFFRSEGMVGDGPNERPIATFDDKQYGASLGGPIVRDKAFFFVNVDFGRKDRPSGWSIDGNSGQAFGRQVEAARFLNIMQTRYNYDPGGTAEFIRDTPNDKFLAKVDWNLNQSHRLSLRHNYVKGSNDIGFPTSVNYVFPDYFYQFRDTTNSSVAQLNSTFGSGSVNELRVTYQTVRDNRDGVTNFPTVLVDVSGGGQFRSGRENFSTANALDQDVLELTDDFTMVRGSHSFTIGTHNEFFQFRNLFIRDNFGTYRFSSLDNLQAGPRAVVRLQLLADRRPAAGRGVQRQPVRLLRGRPLARQLAVHAELRRPPGHPELPRQAHRQPGRGRELRVRDGRGALAEDVVAARGLQLGRLGRRQVTAARRIRDVLRPHPLRVALEPVREHRHRVPPHRRELQRRQPHPVRARSAEPARDRHGRQCRLVHERDRRDRPRLQVPLAAARQPRLRP